MKIITHSEAETSALGIRIAGRLSDGDVIAFYGDLGAGKTHLISAIAKGLGFEGETSSPTFSIVNEYIGGRLPLYHFDMYRITGWEDLFSTGFFDYLDNGGIAAVEWSENIEAALPENSIRITIKTASENVREIEITGGIFDETVSL